MLGKLWSILLPIVLGLLIATVLWPTTRFLRKHGWPPALAASAVLLVAFVAASAGSSRRSRRRWPTRSPSSPTPRPAALQDVQEWLQGPPFNLGEDQIGSAVDSVINSIQDNAQNIAGYALTGVSAVGNSLLNLVLALVLVLLLPQGRAPLRAVAVRADRPAGRAARGGAVLQVLGRRCRSSSASRRSSGSSTPSSSASGSGSSACRWCIPLAVLTFFGGFIPIIGAFVAGAFAVLIALVSNGFTTALIVLGIVILVQQIEGNVLQPIIQGRGFNLHAGVVILAVTAGSSLAGIIGAFLSVPIAALIAVIYRYVRDELDGRIAGGRPGRHAGPASRATSPAPRSCGSRSPRRPTVPRPPPDGDRPRLTPPCGGAWECARRPRGAARDDSRQSTREVPPWPSDRRSSSSCSPRPSASSPGGGRGEPGARGLVLVHDLAGDFDAAHAGALAGAHLLAGLPHEVIARFDADSLVDYRAHRPRMTFSGDRYESFAAPEIALYAVEDDAGVPFLLLHGTEPDYSWERFVAAVAQLVERLGVTSVRRHAGDPDAGAAHPAGHRHRARHAPPAHRAVSGLLGRDAHPRQRLGAAGAPARRGAGSTRWAWPRTCRTTWPRPPTRPRRSRCWSTWSG